jgi:hypothetical protein
MIVLKTYKFFIVVYSSFLFLYAYNNCILYIAMNKITQFKFPVILTVIIILAFAMIVLSTTFMNNLVYAQPKSPTITNVQKQESLLLSPLSSTIPSSSFPSPLAPRLHAVKITSLTKGQQVPVAKDLTIFGTSVDDATSINNNNCQVIVGVNQVKPYQPATAIGPGGASDYSKWNFILTSKYTTIKLGPNNKITAKYTCANNPALSTYSSINITGVPGAATIPVASMIKGTTTSTSSPITSYATITANTAKSPHLMSVNNATIVGPTITPSSSKGNIKNNPNTPISSHITDTQPSSTYTTSPTTTTRAAAQQKPVLASQGPTLLNIKITSPAHGQQVSAGKNLTITGISSDNAATNCKVYAGLNSLKPYQPTLATGPGGAADYSTWRSTYTSPYRTITNGVNKITAELSCNGNPMVKYDILNITGVPIPIAATTTASGLSPISSNSDPTYSGSVPSSSSFPSSSSSSSSDSHTHHSTTKSSSSNSDSSNNHSSNANHKVKSSSSNSDSSDNSNNNNNSHNGNNNKIHSDIKSKILKIYKPHHKSIPTSSSSSSTTIQSVDTDSSNNSNNKLTTIIDKETKDKTDVNQGLDIKSDTPSDKILKDFKSDHKKETETSSFSSSTANDQQSFGEEAGVSASIGSSGATASAGDTNAYAGPDGVSVNAGSIHLKLP